MLLASITTAFPCHKDIAKHPVLLKCRSYLFFFAVFNTEQFSFFVNHAHFSQLVGPMELVTR